MAEQKYPFRASFLGLMLAAASCAQIVGMEEGVLRQDTPANECDVFENCLNGATECRVPAACTNGKCEYNNTIRGKPLTNQMVGDCKNIVCDGDGSTEFVVNDLDLPDDQNGCTMDSCSGGDVLHTPLPGTSIACYGGPSGTDTIGVCHAGTMSCDAQGQPIPPCLGQVVPSPEQCDLAKTDEDCNGMVNETGPEGGVCQCGDGVVSSGLGESCDDANSIGGDGCSPACSTAYVAELTNHYNSTCVRFSNSTVKCWGGNTFGQLGIGTVQTIGDGPGEMGAALAVAPLPSGKQVVRLDVGGNFSCVLLDDNKLRCWGGNENGQLGEGNKVYRGDNMDEMGDFLPFVDLGNGHIAVDFACGLRHACAVLEDGSVKCWGWNMYGQLGLGNVDSMGDDIGEMGDKLITVSLDSVLTAKKIVLGHNHSCAILSNDLVKCWGFNGNGELGIGNKIHQGVDLAQMGGTLPFVDLGQLLGQPIKVKALSAGASHTCAILENDKVKCWGANPYGQLGIGTTVSHGIVDGDMGDALPEVDLGMGRTAKAIAAGVGVTCAILDDDSLKCWGFNAGGQLGRENKVNAGTMPGQMGDTLLPINLGTGRHAIAVDGGNRFVCALLDDTSVKCWGENTNNGRLGNGSNSDFGGMMGDMGDNLPIVKLFSDIW